MSLSNGREIEGLGSEERMREDGMLNKTANCSFKGGSFDLAVIGAGPAGSLTAALAAESGLSTVIVEKKKLPRAKPCGGFVSTRCLSLLPRDMELLPESKTAVKTVSVIKGGRCYSFSSESDLGLLLKREQFDHELAVYATRKGAVLMEERPLDKLERIDCGKTENVCYRVHIGGKGTAPIKARYVVGADGALSRFALLSGLRTTVTGLSGWGLARYVNPASSITGTGRLIFFPLPFLGGMGWSFEGARWINRGVGGLANRRLLKKAFLNLFTEDKKNPLLHFSSWPLPFLGPLKPAGRENLLLVGDAAGLVDPFSGEGLYNSIKSAHLAFLALMRAEKEGKEAGKVYQQLFNEQFQAGFASTMAGTILLHGRSMIFPYSLPRLIAALMENKLWFNRGGEFYSDPV